jgi:hypothetical protein
VSHDSLYIVLAVLFLLAIAVLAIVRALDLADERSEHDVGQSWQHRKLLDRGLVRVEGNRRPS